MQYEFCRICMHARLVRCISRRDWSQDTQTLTCVSNAPGPNLVLNKVVNFEGSILVPEMNCASSKSGKSSSRSSHAGYCVEIKELALIVVIFKVEKSTASNLLGWKSENEYTARTRVYDGTPGAYIQGPLLPKKADEADVACGQLGPK